MLDAGNGVCFILIWALTVAAATVLSRLRACDDKLNEILADKCIALDCFGEPQSIKFT